ncbi:MAG: hypothetical protein V4723_03005 [Pseudomonadota bacterium]
MPSFIRAALTLAISACTVIPSAQAVDNTEEIKRIKAQARAAHPNDQIAQDAAINKGMTNLVAKQTGNPKETATILFLGYYMKNYHGIPVVCSQQGVTMTGFPEAFAAANHDMVIATRKMLDTPGLRAHLKELAGPAARRELNSFAEAEKTDLKGACSFLEKNAQGIAVRTAFAKILPAQYQVLAGSK